MPCVTTMVVNLQRDSMKMHCTIVYLWFFLLQQNAGDKKYGNCAKDEKDSILKVKND